MGFDSESPCLFTFRKDATTVCQDVGETGNLVCFQNVHNTPQMKACLLTQKDAYGPFEDPVTNVDCNAPSEYNCLLM